MSNGTVRTVARGKSASMQQSLVTPQGGGETATFLSFVRMLAGKSEEEQRMLVQVAMQEAATGPPARRQGSSSSTVAAGGLRRSTSAGELRRSNPLRRSASLDGSDFGGRASTGSAVGGGSGIVQMSAIGQAGISASPSLAGPDGRPRSADAGTGSGGQGLGGWHSGPLSQTVGARSHPLRQRQQQVMQQRAAAQLQQQFARRAAASTLQAHWRGWQHRRLARYLRARRKRAMRLDWLWHLEYVTNLMNWHEAAHTVQASWRAHHVRRSLPASSIPSKPPGRRPAAASASAGSSGSAELGGAAQRPESVSVQSSASGQSTAALASPPATAETAAAPETSLETSSETSGGKASAGGAREGVARGVAPKVAGFSPNGGRLTVRWKSELAEVRPYSVPPAPRW